ncbi:MAG: YfhO family protein [Thermodesulfobacteriota bacterium]
MKNDKIKFLLCVLFFTVLAAITFRCAWPAGHVFSASDLNIGRLAFKKHYLPELLTGYFTGNQVLGGSGYGFTLFHSLMALMPLKLFADSFYGLVLIFGSASLIWFLRLWGRSWLASVFGALVAFWFNSIMLAAGGHAYKMEVLAFSVLSLCLTEKAVRSTTIRRMIGYSLLGGVSVGIMMIEQQDVALLAGLFIGSYAVFRLIQVYSKVVLRWVALLVPVAAVAVLLSGSTVLKSYKSNIKGAAAVQERGDGSEKWNYITQWSLVPAEWPDLIASGWSGWGSNDPKGPYWGKIGQSADWKSTGQGFRNFKITSVYFGIIPFLLGAFGLVLALKERKTDEGRVMLFWGIAGLVGLWLAFGKYSLLYKLFFQLPVVSNIRAPMKLLDNFQICLGIMAAFGLDRLLSGFRAQDSSSPDDGRVQASSVPVKGLWISAFAIGGLMLLAGLGLLINSGSQAEKFTQMGFVEHASIMAGNMRSAWFHAALLALLCGGLAFLAWKKVIKSCWIALAFIGILTADSLILTSHYFKADDVAAIDQKNTVISFLKENQGNERTFFVDQSGIYNRWLALDGPFHGLNLFNIWQMPRMSVEYKEFLAKVGRNQIRLWEFSAVKYIAAPGQIQQQLKQNPELGKQFNPVLDYQVPTAKGMRQDVLLEFKGAVPRFALFSNWESAPLEQHCARMVSARHNPKTTLVVDSSFGMAGKPGNITFKAVEARVTKREAVVDVQADQPSILRFAQRYQDGWRVSVDGKPAELLRVDYLSMGVPVPAGKHVVEFYCITGISKVLFSVMVFALSLTGGLVLILPRKNIA